MGNLDKRKRQRAIKHGIDEYSFAVSPEISEIQDFIIEELGIAFEPEEDQALCEGLHRIIQGTSNADSPKKKVYFPKVMSDFNSINTAVDHSYDTLSFEERGELKMIYRANYVRAVITERLIRKWMVYAGDEGMGIDPSILSGAKRIPEEFLWKTIHTILEPI